MTILIRPAKEKDNSLYLSCFENKEFREMICSSEPLNIEDYISDNPHVIRAICSIRHDKNIEDVAFAHFINNGGNCFTIVGGVLPLYFNSGIGVFCAVAAISFFFERHHNHTLLGGVFFHNSRSYRMQHILGFSVIRQQNQRNIFQLTEDKFLNNEVVNRIKKEFDLIIYD